jgi:hypothetical protein
MQHFLIDFTICEIAMADGNFSRMVQLTVALMDIYLPFLHQYGGKEGQKTFPNIKFLRLQKINIWRFHEKQNLCAFTELHEAEQH